MPATNLIGEEGGGFAIAQARLGPGRIHHCMRLIGMAERAIELMCRRAVSRTAFGKPLAQQGVVQNWIADARVTVEQLRLLVLKTAWLMDTVGNRGAHTEIQAIKIATPRAVVDIIDRAIQLHGAGGVSQDFPLAELWASARTLHARGRAGRGPPAVAGAPGAEEVPLGTRRREPVSGRSPWRPPLDAYTRLSAYTPLTGAGPTAAAPAAAGRRGGRRPPAAPSGPSGRYQVDRWWTEPKW